jgi:hypothetical protein
MYSFLSALFFFSGKYGGEREREGERERDRDTKRQSKLKRELCKAKENHFVMLPRSTDNCAISAQLHFILMCFYVNSVNSLFCSWASKLWEL